MALPRRLGPFQLEERLGAGSVGIIYRASTVDPSLKMPRVVAIKVLPEQDHDLRHIERFKHEVAIARAARSPHLAEIYGAGESDEGPFMIVEYLDGKSLSEIITKLRLQRELLSVDQRIKIFIGAARGLAALHTAFDPKDGSRLGATHRDISPGNLMLTKTGRLVVIDLGLGRSKLRHFETQTGVVVGTPAFMAPEVARGGVASTQADVFALGVALFEFVTLDHFVPRTSVARMLQLAQKPDLKKLSKIRTDLQAILRIALALDPKERFESAREFELALRPLVQEDLAVTDAVHTLIGEPAENLFDDATKIDDPDPEPVLTPTAINPSSSEDLGAIVEATWIELDGKNLPLLSPNVVKAGLPPKAAAPTIVDPPRETAGSLPVVSTVPNPAVPTAAADTIQVQAPRSSAHKVPTKRSSVLRALALGTIVAGAFFFGYLTKSVTSDEPPGTPAQVVPLVVETKPTVKPGAVPKPQTPEQLTTLPAAPKPPPQKVLPAKMARQPAPRPTDVAPTEPVEKIPDAAEVLGRLSRRIAILQNEHPERRAELEAELARAVRWTTHPDSAVAFKELRIIENRVEAAN